jgi:hypothetical protein
MSKYSLNRDIERIIENEDTIDNVENGIIQWIIIVINTP